jgi:hypothetical protein
MRHPAAAALSAKTPLFLQSRFVDEKLSGCGTHMEHIVFVHDLFLTLTATNGVEDS